MNTGTADTLLQEAIGLIRANRPTEAHTLLAALCRTDGAHAEHWFLFGAVLHMLGQIEDALAAFERALILQPDHASALNGRASLLAAMGRQEEAAQCLRHALGLRPRDVDAHVNLALVLEVQGDANAAARHYAAALDIDPQCRSARLNRSALHLGAQRFDDALHDAETLLRVNPSDVAARVNAAKALLGMDRYADVVAACRLVLAADPRHVGARVDLGVALAALGRFDESRAAFEAARTADPELFAQVQRRAWSAAGPDLRQGWPQEPDMPPDPRAIHLVRGAERLARCDWSGRDAYLSTFDDVVRNGIAAGSPVCDWALPFVSTWLPLADDVREAVAQAVSSRVEASIAHVPIQPVHPVRRGGEPLRIGYVSTKFRNHPGATLCTPLLELHDRTRVTVHGYALNPYDAGLVAERFRRSCDHVRECWGRTDAAIAQQIRDDGIHILVDVSGYTDFARPEVFALRPAPVQVGYLGFMTSLRAPWIDYFVTDAVATPPEHALQWQEHLVYLPRTLLCYDAPPAERPQPPTREQCGLPARGFVFCCFNNTYKIEPRAFSLWMRLLGRVPGSVLWLLHERETAVNLRRAAAAHGIDPSRLVFAPRIERAKHLARQQHADLFLDTFEYNAHTTAAEAYHAGLPVLTLPGRTTVGRCGASIGYGVGMAELIAPDEAHYEALALRLATEPGLLSNLKMRLAQERVHSPLFDGASLARAFEHAFETMWERHAGGFAPAPFALGPEALGKSFDDALIAPFMHAASGTAMR